MNHLHKTPSNWIIRVYDGDVCVQQWIVNSRTENEAERETAAVMAAEFSHEAPSGNEFDWTLTALANQ